MIPVLFHPHAQTEMSGAAVYYEAQQKDLGKRFLLAVQDAVKHIQINPSLYPVVHLDVRRSIVQTFPFSVLFRIRPDSIMVMAVMHQRRDPDCWKSRS